jgi:hypothetical protein
MKASSRRTQKQDWNFRNRPDEQMGGERSIDHALAPWSMRRASCSTASSQAAPMAMGRIGADLGKIQGVGGGEGLFRAPESCRSWSVESVARFIGLGVAGSPLRCGVQCCANIGVLRVLETRWDTDLAATFRPPLSTMRIQTRMTPGIGCTWGDIDQRSKFHRGLR